MNNLIDMAYALHILWSYIKYKINKYDIKNIFNNLKYLTLPVIYLTVILFVVPVSDKIINTVTYQKMDSYTIAVVTEENKLSKILEKYNLTNEQFKVLCGIILSEADKNSYEDTYAVVNTIYNRTHSKNWVRSVDNKFGQGRGMNLYYQAISPGQFTVYASGSYQRHMNDTTSVGYQAIIDFLYTEEILHNYLSFRSSSIKVNGSEQFSSNGNNYFNVLEEGNRI